MCFILNESSKIEILKEDKIVYKWINVNNHSIYYSEFKWKANKRYELGKSLKIDTISRKEYDYQYSFKIINKGFHGYIHNNIKLFPGNKLIKLTIPEGAEYIENKITNEYVSNIVETKSLKNIYDNKPKNKEFILLEDLKKSIRKL